MITLWLSVVMLAGCAGGQSQNTDAQIQEQFDRFTQDMFMDIVASSTLNTHFMLTDPEAYGLEKQPVTWGKFSLEELKNTDKELREQKEWLDSINPAQLTESQKVTYDILQESINTDLSSSGMKLYSQVLSPVVGLQSQTPILLAEYQFYKEQDVKDYLELISQMDEYYADILTFEKEKAKEGLSMSDGTIERVQTSCKTYANLPEENFLTETFTERLESLESIPAEQKAAYEKEHSKLIREDFTKAYQLLDDGLEELKGTSKSETGLNGLPQGKKYYEYLVKSYTGMSYPSVNALIQATEKHIDKELTKMVQIVQRNPQVAEQAMDYQFALTDPVKVMEDLKKQTEKDFPALSQCDYTIKYVPEALEEFLSPAFYLTSPIDNPKDNHIYLNRGMYQMYDMYPLLAHEGYPGHLYQNVYSNTTNLCDLRKALHFGSYIEGWGTYVEYYSYSLDNGLDKDLGEFLRCNESIMLAYAAYIDLNVNYNGWTKEQVEDFTEILFTSGAPEMAEFYYNTVIDEPANYVQYFEGYLELITMRDQALKKTGLKEYNTFILDFGPAQFSVIRPYFEEWLKQQA